jgi:L-aminopeptidase/D-esterase-like protein
VGHATDLDAITGCTAILCPPNTVAGVDVRGGAPGTRETALLEPLRNVQHVNAVMLAGGSAYGLAAADGAMRYLEENGIGYTTATGHLVPIVPAAILFDLAVGRGDVRPDAAMGYAACAAATVEPVAQGSIGAGTGCRIGAIFGNALATKGGIGSANVDLGGDLIVAALCAVNAVGDVIAENGQIIGGLRSPDGGFMGVLEAFRQMPRLPAPSAENTVLGVVATNARLNKVQANKVAQMAHDGVARAVRPAHTMYDGDTIFALATGEIDADVNLIGAYAAEVTAAAIRNAILLATTLGGVQALG